MSDYRRVYQPGGSYFFTVVTHQRTKSLSDPNTIARLKSVFDKIRGKYPFTMQAFAILPDHVHCIWQRPTGDSDFSLRWRLIKSSFSAGLNHPVNQRGEREIWQRRFWEHLLRDEEDWRRHMDYIHYNPVKHGYVRSPGDWPHSSFRQAVQEGLYGAELGAVIPGTLSGMDLE